MEEAGAGEVDDAEENGGRKSWGEGGDTDAKGDDNGGEDEEGEEDEGEGKYGVDEDEEDKCVAVEYEFISTEDGIM